MEYDPSTDQFYESEFLSLAHARNFPHPYGWIKESGTPPKSHLDVFLLTDEKFDLGDEVAVKIVGCFIRSDGDSKLISVLPNRLENDLSELPETEINDLKRLYPILNEGEGWFGFIQALEIIDTYFKKSKA